MATAATLAVIALSPQSKDQAPSRAEHIVESLLKPGTEKLTIRPDDGTVLQGNHRIKILEERGFDTSKLFDKADVRIKESLAPWE